GEGRVAQRPHDVCVAHRAADCEQPRLGVGGDGLDAFDVADQCGGASHASTAAHSVDGEGQGAHGNPLDGWVGGQAAAPSAATADGAEVGQLAPTLTSSAAGTVGEAADCRVSAAISAPAPAMAAAPQRPAEKPSVSATGLPIWSAPYAAATAVMAARPSA